MRIQRIFFSSHLSSLTEFSLFSFPLTSIPFSFPYKFPTIHDRPTHHTVLECLSANPAFQIAQLASFSILHTEHFKTVLPFYPTNYKSTGRKLLIFETHFFAYPSLLHCKLDLWSLLMHSKSLCFPDEITFLSYPFLNVSSKLTNQVIKAKKWICTAILLCLSDKVYRENVNGKIAAPNWNALRAKKESYVNVWEKCVGFFIELVPW